MKTVRGDLIELAKEGEFDLIVHGCNCFCTMGAGIALQIAREFPGEFGPELADRITGVGNKNKLGNVSYGLYFKFKDPNQILIIANGYTQYSVAGQHNPVAADYEAIRSVFRRIREFVLSCNNPEEVRIGYPAIGAGLAGGDWSIIHPIICEELDGLNHTYVEYNGE